MTYTFGELEKLKQKLMEHREAYYNAMPKTKSGLSLISDAEYDKLEDILVRNIPADDPWFDIVGHTPSSGWTKETHEIPMGSQLKINTEEEIVEFCDKVKTDKGYVLEHKVDGFSLASIYDALKLEKAITRGNGIIGENITNNAKRFRGLPKRISTNRRIVVRSEAFLSKENFEKVQKSTGDGYENARNAASGISRRHDGSHSQFIQILCYDIEGEFKTEMEKLALLEALGFPVVKFYFCRTAKEIIDHYRKYKQGKREGLDYEIDGFVIKYNDIEIQESLGIKNKRPLGQVALKFESDQGSTKVNSIALQVGRTGVVTPLAMLEPVKLMGSTISKATLHNFAEIKRLGLGEGDEVTIERGGDIIPKVTEVVVSAGKEYKEPSRCPSCNGVLINDSVNIWCKNSPCREKDVNRIHYWIKKLEIKDFSTKFLGKLYDQDKIRNIGDLYKLVPDDFDSIDGIGEKTVKSFFKKLEESSEMYLEEFIVALGIPTCSETSSRMLVTNFGSWDRICKVKPSDIIGIPGYQERSATSICEGIAEIEDMAKDLLSVVKIKQKKTAGKLKGKSVCVTGELTSMSRNDFKKLVAVELGEFKSSVSEGLSYLVTNDADSGSGKAEKAKKYGTTVISEADFFKTVLGQNPPSNKKEDKTDKIAFNSLF
jgi:DNA ligase (NAD+)